MKNWKVNSWRKYPVKHIPEYPDKKELDQVLNKIKISRLENKKKGLKIFEIKKYNSIIQL